ncbi:MAG TPA: PAS domain-containing sensor histidine kinase [Parafilimonas sp.]|nr:PAS domain-containing sensor histidine kinase [Parafilimonas sp.]
MPKTGDSNYINNEEQLKALFNYATIGIIVTDSRGTIVNFNKQAEAIFGYLKEEVVGKTVELLIPADLRKAHEHHREDFYQQPSPRNMGHGRDLFGQRKDGSEFPVEVSLSNYTLENELFIIAFVIDITTRKQHEAVVLQQKKELETITTQVKQLNRDLEKKIQDRTKMLRETLSALEASKEDLSAALKNEKELGELKSRFVTMASHEFKTPLSTILSSAFLLEKYNNTPDAVDKRLKHTERIKNAVADMKNILDDFLSLGKLEEGLIRANMATIPAEVCFNEVDNAIVEMETNLKKGQRIDFIRNGDGQVMIDKHLLKNIVINLLSNAIKFSPENSLIEINCSTYNSTFALSVKDVGIGISAEDKEHLFERFFRAKNAINIQGTGLGLHIIAKYLELMRGSIELESTLNEGSIFTIHIPKKRKHASEQKNIGN